MRCNAAALALLLLAVSNLCIGRALPGRGKYETSSEVLNTALEGSASSHAGVYDPARAFGSVGKRTIPKLKPGGVDPFPPGSSKGGQTGSNQAGGSGQRGDGQQAPNDQYGGDQGKSPDPSPPSALKPATDPATAPAPPSVETRYTAPKPVGMNEADLAFWKSFDDNPLNLRDSDQLMLWSGDIAAGAPRWKSDGIFSIKFAEVCANHPQPLHILYGSSADDKLPSNAWLTLAELGIVTGPGSKIPVIYRWDKDTVDFNLRLGQEPTYNVLWEAGDPPLAPEFLDITKDLKNHENMILLLTLGCSNQLCPMLYLLVLVHLELLLPTLSLTPLLVLQVPEASPQSLLLGFLRSPFPILALPHHQILKEFLMVANQALALVRKPAGVCLVLEESIVSACKLLRSQYSSSFAFPTLFLAFCGWSDQALMLFFVRYLWAC
ncbi:hypothetical protein DL98DRAFT_536435 [Cadophora sp. DSE1049]|nr:hypothetical protein DL98DRAFT_536435 [Cadophora sp. DSE1049]